MNTKAVSPMIATILLVAFTIAVGGIISVWLTGFTRTQTATAGAGAACLSSNVRIFSPLTSTPVSTVNVYITNLRTDMDITVNSVTVNCGGLVETTPTSTTIMPGRTEKIDVTLDEEKCTSTNTEITVIGSCSGGGTLTAMCPAGTCAS